MVYHGTQHLFKIPSCGIRYHYCPSSGVGFQCSTTRMGAKEHVWDKEISYIYEYEFTPGQVTPMYANMDILSEIIVGVGMIGKQTKPELYDKSVWNSSGARDLAEHFINRYGGSKVLFNTTMFDLSNFVGDSAMVVQALVDSGFTHSIISANCEYDDKRCDIAIFNNKTLKLKKAVQLHADAGGFELDITDGVKKMML